MRWWHRSCGVCSRAADRQSPPSPPLAATSLHTTSTHLPLLPHATAAVLKGHYSAVTSLSLSPDGWTLLSGGRDSVVVAWNMRDHSKLSTVPVFEALEGEMGWVAGWLVNMLHGGRLRRWCQWYGWYGLGFRATACTGHGHCLGGVARVSTRLVASTFMKPCWHHWSLSCCCLDPPHPTHCCRHRVPAARHAVPRLALRRRSSCSSWRQGRQGASNLLCHRRRERCGQAVAGRHRQVPV